MSRIQEMLLRFWRERRRTAVLTAFVVLLVLVSLAVNLPGLSGSVGASLVDDQLALLAERQEHLKMLFQEKRRLQGPINVIGVRSGSFWQEQRDGNPAIDFRRRIEEAARHSGITLKTIGAMQNSRLAAGATAYEIPISGQGKYDQLQHFFEALNPGEERTVFWSTLSLQPDNIRAPSYLVVNGALKIIAVSAPEILQLWEEP